MSRAEERPYSERVALAATVTRDGPICTVHNFRSMTYPTPETRSIEWRTEVFDRREITNVWLVASYWTPTTLIGHNMLHFELADGRVLSSSVEIRPRKGQSFNSVKGLLRTYELTTVWSTESDALLSRAYGERAAGNKSRIHLLEGNLSQAVALRILDVCIDRTNELQGAHEMYNTFLNSCTTNIYDIVAEVLPGHFRGPFRYRFAGYMPRLFATENAIRLRGSFEETMASSEMNDQILAIGDVPDFSSRLRDELGRRHL